MWCRISQRSADEYPFLALPSPRRALHIVQVVVPHRLELRVFARRDIAEGSGTEVRSQIREEKEKPREEERSAEEKTLYQLSPSSECGL